MNNFNEKIDHLLANYSFDQLGDQDMQMVQEHMTESEYKMYQNIISAAGSTGKQNLPTLPPHLKSNLTKSFHNKIQSRRPSLLKKTIIAASWILIGGLIGFLYSNYVTKLTDTNYQMRSAITITDTIYITQIDTIIKTIESKPKVIIKELIKLSDNKVPSPTLSTPVQTNPIASTSNQNEASQIERSNYFNNVELTDLTNTKVGITIGQEADLMELLQLMPSDGLE